MSKMAYLKGMPIAVLGGGAVGKTCAADNKLAGREVRLYDAMPFAAASLKDVDKTGILLDGVQRNKYCFERSGRAYLDLVTTDIAAAVKGAGHIIIAMGSWGHEATFRALIPHLENGQVVNVFADNFGCLLLRRLIADLKGKKVAVGSAGSGTEVMARQLLALYDMSYDDINEDFLGFGDASTGLKDKTLDAAIIWAGAPTSGLLELGAQNDFYMIDIPADKIAKLKETQPFCVEVTIDSTMYSGMKNTATTIGVPATLCVRENLDEDLVYDFLTYCFEHLDQVADAHTQGANLSLETALLGLENTELHPGAVRFYTEKGLL